MQTNNDQFRYTEYLGYRLADEVLKVAGLYGCIDGFFDYADNKAGYLVSPPDGVCRMCSEIEFREFLKSAGISDDLIDKRQRVSDVDLIVLHISLNKGFNCE